MTSHHQDSASQSQNTPKRISNPRRLLILSPTPHSQAIVPPLLHSLTGALPVDVSLSYQAKIAETATTVPPTATADVGGDNDDDGIRHGVGRGTVLSDQAVTSTTPSSFAGYTTHTPLQITTKYYMAEIPIWVDEIPLPVGAASGTTSLGSSTVANTSTNTTTITTATPTQWKAEFLSSEARVVRDAIGVVLVCIQNPDAASSRAPASSREELRDELDPDAGILVLTTKSQSYREDVRALKDLLRAVSEVKSHTEAERGEIGDVPGLLVLVGKQQQPLQQPEPGHREEEAFSVEWWEDELYEVGAIGFEIVIWDPRANSNKEERRNRFGEYEGMRRVREVLEAHQWADSHVDKDTDRLLDSEEEDGFNFEVDELEQEMMGLRTAIEKTGRDDQNDDDGGGGSGHGDAEWKVEEMEALMMRMRAIRDIGAELPETERKSFAEKAIRDIMKEF